jgi:hypothetical protein
MPPREYITFDPKKYNREYYLAHKDSRKEKDRAYYLANKEKRNAYSRQKYWENREKRLEYSRNRNSEMKAWYRSMLKQLMCVECGETDYRVLEWHHRDPTTKEIDVGNNVQSKKRRLAEMAKCDLLCANCHRRRHWAE